MKPNCKRNYDYVALQATENSIPFYESLGFVRVGGITEDEKFEEKQAKLKAGGDPSSHDSVPSSPDDSAPQSEIVSSAVDVYVTKVAGEAPADIAKKLNVDVWDVIFLNHYVYPDIGPRSRLMKDTSLYVPSTKHAQAEATSNATRIQSLGVEPIAPQWYIAAENDTPRMIAKTFHISCTELVEGNRERLPELNWQSRLKEGTRIKVSHFHIHDDKHVPYCHWTFPDDTFETSEPSYMMVRKLNRRSGAMAKVKPVESSLAVSITQFTAPPSDLFNEVQVSQTSEAGAKGKTSATKNRPAHASEPKKPKRPLSGYMMYCRDQRETMKDDIIGMKGQEVMKIISKMWRDLPESGRAPYIAKQAKEQSRYKMAMEKYEKDLTSFYEANPQLKPSARDGNDAKSQTLFNKVVKLNAEGMAQTGSEYEYYFVLTFIPDLCWAHLAPLRRVGTWGPDKPKAEGRPIWMLVDESEGKEVDISGSFCIPVRSRAMKRTIDADCEQWDIIDTDEAKSYTFGNGRAINFAPSFANRANGVFNAEPTATFNARKSHLSTKPLSDSIEQKSKQSNPQQSTGKKKRGRPRKHPLPETNAETPAPLAKQQHSATKPLTGSIEPKKKKVDRPRKHPPQEPDAGKPVAGRSRQAPKQPTPSTSCSRRRRTGSDPEDDDWDPDTEMSVPERLGRSPRQSRSATKPLTGTLERKKRKRAPTKAPCKRRTESGTEGDVLGSGTKKQNPNRRGRPHRQSRLAIMDEQQASDVSVQEDSRPTKRRKLPRRGVKPVLGSLQDADSDEDGGMTPLTCTYTRKRRQTPIRSTSRAPNSHGGNSPFRTVALMRSAQKLSMESPLMFSPRRGRVRG